MPPHLYIGMEWAGGLRSKALGSLAKGGGRISLLFFPTDRYPLFSDPGLIPLGYDTIPFKRGS
jgi:hypothetical protein